MHCLLILPFICSYMWDLTSKTHIWCVSDFVLKIGYYNTPHKQDIGEKLSKANANASKHM